MHLLTTTIHAAVTLMADPTPTGGTAAIPNPGGGVAPPGAEKFTTILQWLAWIVTALCVAGVLIVAGRMAAQYRSHGGGGGEAVTGLIWVFGACILVGSASTIVGILI